MQEILENSSENIIVNRSTLDTTNLKSDLYFKKVDNKKRFLKEFKDRNQEEELKYDIERVIEEYELNKSRELSP